MKLKFTLLLIIILINPYSFFGQKNIKTDKVTVLNFATFHLSNTTDANSSTVDINNPDVKRDVNRIVQKLVEFEPTIICVEIPRKNSASINEIYQSYKTDQANTTNWSEEINSIAFEVGRLSGVENIYSIDHKLGFDYPKLMQLAQASDSEHNKEFLKKNSNGLEKFNNLSILGKFQIMNTEEWRSETLNFYNFLSTIHTVDNLEGVEIISDFYKRNLAIYSNFSDIPKDNNDRVLIILGGTHSAYLDLFLENNPNIELVDPIDFVVP
jgi:hypothetical protein